MKKKQRSSPRIRLAIGVPTTGYVRVEWTESLLYMQRALLNDVNLKVDDVKIFYYCSSVIPKNRSMIIKQSQTWGATHMLWIDDDMRFPPIAAKALLYGMKQHPEIKLLGANCIKRKFPIEYMASYYDDTEVVSWGKKGIEQVRYTGNSFMLMNMEVFKEIEEPWFAFAWHQDSKDFGTEDVYFMYKAAQKGIYTYVDHDVSQLIDHIGIFVFKPEHRIDRRGHPGLPDWLVSGEIKRGPDSEGESGSGTVLNPDELGGVEGRGVDYAGQSLELPPSASSYSPLQGEQTEEET